MSTPEIKQEETNIGQPEQVVTVIPESINTIPREVEAGGVRATPTQITAQVIDDTGKPMMQSPATQKITVTLPASTEQLTVWSKGSPSEALTWLAGFWLRLVKKAALFGWNVITGGAGKVQST